MDTKYSRVPNKRTGLLLENGKKNKIPPISLFQNYMLINFLQKVPPIHLFQPVYFFYFGKYGPPVQQIRPFFVRVKQ